MSNLPKNRFLNSLEYRQIDLKTLDNSLDIALFRTYNRKAIAPVQMHLHTHEIEIAYMSMGSQIFHVDDKNYEVHSNQYFIVKPNEEHSLGNENTSKSHCYYVKINVHDQRDHLLGLSISDSNLICDSLLNINERIVTSYNATNDLEKIFETYYKEGPYQLLALKNFCLTFLINFIQNLNNTNTSYSPRIKKALTFIDQNACSSFNINSLAKVTGLSKSTFTNYFKNEVGMTPMNYVLRKRIEFAQELILNSKKTITEIAFESGFNSTNYFATVFKKYTTHSPREFYKLNKNL